MRIHFAGYPYALIWFATGHVWGVVDGEPVLYVLYYGDQCHE